MDAVFGTLGGVGVLAAGFGFAYSQFKSGATKAKDDLIETLQKSLAVEKEKFETLSAEQQLLIKSYQEQLNVLNKEIGRLQGLHEANEKKIKDYMEIFQGRSPEQTKFMENITQIAIKANNFMDKTEKTILETRDFMAAINKRFDAGTLIINP